MRQCYLTNSAPLWHDLPQCHPAKSTSYVGEPVGHEFIAGMYYKSAPSSYSARPWIYTPAFRLAADTTPHFYRFLALSSHRDGGGSERGHRRGRTSGYRACRRAAKAPKGRCSGQRWQAVSSSSSGLFLPVAKLTKFPRPGVDHALLAPRSRRGPRKPSKE